MNRLIGRYDSGLEGPLLIIFGAMHGNEPAGVKALELLFQLIHNEPQVNPGFKFRGRVTGLIGNLQALKLNQRFIEKDLNRQWKSENISRVRKAKIEDLKAEDLEMRQILDLIIEEVKDTGAKEMVILDLHTTSSHGGIFIIPSNAEKSLDIAKQMHAPVVTGFLNGIYGTTLHYFDTDHFPLETTGITFEAGQHEESLSMNRAIAAIINLMCSIHMINEEDVENHHDELLIKHSRNLPKVSKLVLRHPVEPEDEFSMLPNFKNFQSVAKNQQLAIDRNGPIYAPQDSLILMPLYQDQGEDGFFLVEELKDL